MHTRKQRWTDGAMLALTAMLTGASAWADTAAISSSTNLTASQAALYAGVDVTVTGSGVVLTLGTNGTYGTPATYQFNSLIVTNGASVICLGQTNAPYTVTNAGAAIQSAGDVTIAAGCSINANATGFLCLKGPGAGTGLREGGNYAGLGQANVSTVTYGNPLAPTSLGSGGSQWSGPATQSMGGGAVSLIVAGTLTVNGTLSAAGGNSANTGGLGNGGGAGGSVWLNVSTLAGSGSISANGGIGDGSGGGGGGRVAIYYKSSSFTGLPANGLYTNMQSESSTVTAKGAYNTSANGVEDGSVYVLNTTLPAVDNASGAVGITSASAWLMGTVLTTGAAPTTVICFWGTSDGSNNITAWAHTDTVSTVVGLVSNYVSSLASPPTTYYYRYYVTNSYGVAWATPTMSFQTIVPPVVGNDVDATAVDGTTAMLHGVLTAGGSALVTVYWGLNATTPENAIPLGTETQAGGSFSTALTGLTPLTHYYYQCYATNGIGQAWSPVTDFWTTATINLLTNTTLSAGATNLYANRYLVVSGCTLTLAADTNYGTLANYSLLSLTVNNGGSVVGLGQTNGPTYDANAKGVAIQSAGDVTIAAGCSINANATGFIIGKGPGGAGTGLRKGGNYAGLGQANVNTVTYGDLLSPTSLGSGGSNNQGGNSSAGGGAIKLTVAGTLTVNGTLSAAGGSGGPGYTGNGGGAGGSVWLDVGTLAGSGSISANGGFGDAGNTSGNEGGEGGGGRIAITYRHKGFVGLPAPGVYTNLQSISSTVTVKGGYNISADGPEDGSIAIGQIPLGTAVYIR